MTLLLKKFSDFNLNCAVSMFLSGLLSFIGLVWNIDIVPSED